MKRYIDEQFKFNCVHPFPKRIPGGSIFSGLIVPGVGLTSNPSKLEAFGEALLQYRNYYSAWSNHISSVGGIEGAIEGAIEGNIELYRCVYLKATDLVQAVGDERSAAKAICLAFLACDL